MIADVKLRPEAEALVAKYASKDATTPSVDFHKTDISDWGQIACLWKKTLETFSKRLDVLILWSTVLASTSHPLARSGTRLASRL